MKKYSPCHNQLQSSVVLYTAGQIRAIEQAYAKSTGHGTYPLMEKAGASAYQLLKSHWPDARCILVLAGRGNNAGDGFILATLAVAEGKEVTLCHFDGAEKLQGDARSAFAALPKTGIRFAAWGEVADRLDAFDLILDAMLGTGVQGAVREPFSAAITQVNQCKTPVLAIDLPSGLNADTGVCQGVCIEAATTITYIAFKRGLYTADAADYCGDVYLDELGVDPVCFQNHGFNPVSECWHSLNKHLKPRKKTAHKGDFGHSLIVGGAEGMLGAAFMAATAAARSGSGLTTAWLEQGSSGLVISRPEIMARDFDRQAIADLFSKPGCLDRYNSWVVGPGIGQSDWAYCWLENMQDYPQKTRVAKVWDADALNFLASHADHDHNRILTPHPGEAARLLATSVKEVHANRFAASAEIAKKYGGVCVLKGAGTVVSNSQGLQIVCPVGNPGMASGGMGDLLSGIIGGLLAQGFPLLTAASLGVCIHGEAADRAAGGNQHFRGLLASDLLAELPALLNPLPSCRV